MLTSTLTDISGSSACFNQSWITYSNESKVIELDVNPNTLAEHGAVSAEVALQMATGARKKSNSEIAISITGIAGPKGGTNLKPVGLVYIGIKKGNKISVNKCLFKSKKRSSIQRATVKKALDLILRIAK